MRRKMPSITERHRYRKLWGQKSARLVECGECFIFEEADSCADFIRYNQETEDGKIIPLSDGPYFVLRFIGEKGIPFTIVRRQNYEAMNYYRNLVGREFRIRIER